MNHVCERCNTENKPTAKFCKRCGVILRTAPRRPCPAGLHEMHPGWTSCPYCEQMRQPAAEEGEPMAAGGEPGFADIVTEAGEFPRAPLTRGPAQQPAGGLGGAVGGRPQPRRVTDVLPPTGEAGRPLYQGRRIIGALITYTWKPEGQLFPLREGRNRIGRNDECEVCLPNDGALSNVNTHIYHYPDDKACFISDAGSQNGTHVNGQNIRQDSRRLSGYATIRTGATVWTFISATPDAAVAAGQGA